MKWAFDGKRIKTRRLELGLKRYHMTIRFGINNAQLKLVEEGLSMPNVKLLCDCARALDVSPSYFFVAIPE